MVDSTAIIPFIGDDAPTPTSLVAKQLDATDIIGDNPELAEETNDQPDAAAKEGSAYSGHVACVVAQMSTSYRSASLSSGESYYSNVVQTVWVGERPMSLSNKLAVVIPIKDTDPSPLSDKGKGSTAGATVAPPARLDDKSFAAFAWMTTTD